jgi:hypothetical protein
VRLYQEMRGAAAGRELSGRTAWKRVGAMVKIAPTRAGGNDALGRTLRLPLNDIIAATEVKLKGLPAPCCLLRSSFLASSLPSLVARTGRQPSD